MLLLVILGVPGDVTFPRVRERYGDVVQENI